MEESVSDVENGIAQLIAQDHPRDLDYGREIPATPDLFADGIEIAQRILDWEEQAGQSITPLLDHCKAARQLRESVTAKATAPAAEPAPQEVHT
jgi:hypothetical protein